MTAVDQLFVTEIFRSIQGESTRAGLPCAFVRLSGCNLRCRWCDTAYSYDPGPSLTLDDVISRLRDLPAPLVEVTGGEPLLQPATVPLLKALLDLASQPSSPFKEIMIETNGSLDIALIPQGVLRVIDVKCPASGMHARMLPSNLEKLRPTDEIKFVLADRADYVWARDFVLRDRRLDLPAAIHFTPAGLPSGPALDPKDLADWILADRLPVRLSLQLHKIIWGPGTRR